MALATIEQAQGRQLDRLADLCAGASAAPWRSLSDYFAQHYQLFADTELAALLEPRRSQAPPGYHSIKNVSAGLFVLLGNRVVQEARGLPYIPTEIAAHVVAYQLIRYRAPIYFITQDFVRAVAATDLPHDFTLDDLHWPMPAMVAGFPTQFMKEYVGRDVCFIYAANCDAGECSVPSLPGCPASDQTLVWLSHLRRYGNSPVPHVRPASRAGNNPQILLTRRFSFSALVPLNCFRV